MRVFPAAPRRGAVSVLALLSLPSVLPLAHAQDAAPEPGPAPIQVAQGAGGKNFLNIAVDALMAAGASTEPDVEALEFGGHDPAQQGFTLQALELVLDGAVDPYFRGQANIVLQIDPEGETSIELEEAFAVTSSLAHDLQVKAGQFLTEFGRHNPTHPHTWDFVDQPLVAGRMFGGDGLRSLGARLSWLMPVPVYSELLFTLQNAAGETMTSFGSVAGETQFGRPIDPDLVRNFGDMLYGARWNGSFDVSESSTLVVGASGEFGPNGTGPGADTSIAGLDAFWKWKSPRAQRGFPFVKLQAEALARRYEAAATATLPAATFEDHGAYGQVVWGIKPMWTAGVRYDTVGGDVGDDPTDLRFQPRQRLAVAGTWYATEYSKLRLQVAHDDRTGADDALSAWIQFEFLLGAHAAHKF